MSEPISREQIEEAFRHNDLVVSADGQLLAHRERPQTTAPVSVAVLGVDLPPVQAQLERERRERR